jgi:hypothetical protein
MKQMDRDRMISERIKCRDGFTMSVQASAFHYCSPRETGLGFYEAYEVGYPSEVEPLLMPYAEDADRPTQTVYGYVPAQVIVSVIAKHEGIAGAANNVRKEDQ